VSGNRVEAVAAVSLGGEVVEAAAGAWGSIAGHQVVAAIGWAPGVQVHFGQGRGGVSGRVTNQEWVGRGVRGLGGRRSWFDSVQNRRGWRRNGDRAQVHLKTRCRIRFEDAEDATVSE